MEPSQKPTKTPRRREFRLQGLPYSSGMALPDVDLDAAEKDPWAGRNWRWADEKAPSGYPSVLGSRASSGFTMPRLVDQGRRMAGLRSVMAHLRHVQGPTGTSIDRGQYLGECPKVNDVMENESELTSPAETPSAASDEALVDRAKAKDFEAFEQLVARYEDKVYRLAFRFVRNDTDAQEIVQETFLSLWRKIDSFKGDSQFSSWLYRVTANAALMRLRSQRRHPEISTEELEPGVMDRVEQIFGQASGGDNWARRPDDELQSDELRTWIQKAVDQLPDMYRAVFLLRDVEGMSTEDTAEALGVTIPTVKTRLHRARIALRQTISEYFQKK